MALTHADVRRILDILDRAANLESLEVSIGDFVLRAHKPGAAAAAAAPGKTGEAAAVPQHSPRTAVDVTVPEGMIGVRAPMVGTFYRRPNPEEPPFVEEGARVDAGAPLCLVEAMKLFNTVSAPAAGRIMRIVADDRQVVQHDALLMIIEPDSPS
jgi:acetyl-CoA carboxylase biotin carboxyl carrier protein